MSDNQHDRVVPGIVMNSDGTVKTCCGIPMIAFLLVAVTAAQTFHWV
jgi:hypothetical protein